jgi:hypothetical protein
METDVAKKPYPSWEGKGFLVGFENPRNSPLFPHIPIFESKFLGIIFG